MPLVSDSAWDDSGDFRGSVRPSVKPKRSSLRFATGPVLCCPTTVYSRHPEIEYLGPLGTTAVPGLEKFPREYQA
jgi:hypothetical protein